jgi:hypothetical protein
MMASQYPQKLTAENRQGRHLQPFAVSRPLQINHLRRENLRRGSRIGELGLGEIKPKIPEHDRSFSGPAREGYEAPPDNVRPVGVVRALDRTSELEVNHSKELRVTRVRIISILVPVQRRRFRECMRLGGRPAQCSDVPR